MLNSVSRLWMLALVAAAVATPVMAVDSDGDGVDDAIDNCSAAANPDQRDSDGDGIQT